MALAAPGHGAGLDAWLAYHQTLHPRRIELGLERTREVLERLDLKRPDLVITVAGTNGKGSSVAMFDALLRTPGQRTGAFTSPHLVHYNERIAIDGIPAADAAIVAAFERIEAARGDIPVTYFEAATLAALSVFAAAGAETIILEVGLGGRLDAVNAIAADGMLVTSIDLDHQHWLGDTREAIGAEKAGIFRAGRPCVFSGPDMPDSVARVAADCGAPLWQAGWDYVVEMTSAERWTYRSPTRTLTDLPLPGIAGRQQVANAGGVLALLERLDRLPDDAGARLAAVRVAGRFQTVRQHPDWIVDVAHNPASAAELATTLAARPASGRTHAIVGMLGDKDVAGSVAALAAVVDVWHAAPADSERGLGAQPVAHLIAATLGKPCAWFDTLDEAIAVVAADCEPHDRVLVFGSFRIAGPALEQLAL